MNSHYLFISILIFGAWLLFTHILRYLFKLWYYCQIKKNYYDGRPRAWYPPNEKPRLFFKSKKQIS